MSNFKCNLVVPGFAKSGTSSLHEYLDIHPDICMSTPKETHFFARDERYVKGYDLHNKIFEKCYKHDAVYYGESSTLHSIWEPALDRIKADLYNPKIILLLRHPLERLISHYNWLWSLTLEDRPLLEAVFAEQKNGFHPNRPVRGSGNYACYLIASNYSFWCPLIIEKFGKKNVLFLDSDELFREREKAVNRCFNFLEIKSIEIIDDIHENKTGEAALQRTLGLKYIKNVTNFIPSSVKEQLDPNHKIRHSVWNLYCKIMGRKKARSKPTINKKDILELERLIQRDILFYKEVLQKK